MLIETRRRQNLLFKTVNGLLDGAARGVKALAPTFPRGAPWGWIGSPRTSAYAVEVGQGLDNSIVAGLIGWATRNFPEAPWRMRRAKRVGKKIEWEPILEDDFGLGAVLTLLQDPNPYYDGETLMKACLVDWMTAANVYILKRRNNADRVVELWWLPQWMVEPMWPQDDPTVYIGWYRYNPNGEWVDYHPDDIIHLRDGLDPRNPRKGLNRFASLVREIFTDEEAAAYSAAILNNLGIPGVIISPKTTGIASQNRITDPQGIRDKFKERFRGDGRGEPLVLTAPTDVTMLSFNPQQLTLKDLRRLPEERASSVMGIPAILGGLGAGLDRSTYANMGEARESGYEEFIIPTQRIWGRSFKKHLANEFGDPKGIVIDKDLSEVRVLQEDQTNLWKRNLDALTGGGITRRVFKENIGEETDDKDDVYYIPANVDVINADETPPEVGAFEEEEEPDPLTLPPVAAGATNGNGNGSRQPVTA